MTAPSISSLPATWCSTELAAMAEGDKFEAYYTEKFWQMVPGIYREMDAATPTPGVLRALIGVMARQAARVRRSNDRVWEDMFIEFCDDWAVPYLGELVSTRLVPISTARARRADVAKTIYYRRRAGTLAVLEELIIDVTGWEGVVVEQFRRLARTVHLLEPAPPMLAGRLTGTLQGGFPDLHRQDVDELVGGPFEEFNHTVDVRQYAGGVDGRYNIPKLGFYLYRLQSLLIDGVTPAELVANDPTRWTLDPSGRDVQLFMASARPPPLPGRGGGWQRAQPWNLPAPLTCRLLGDPEARPDLLPPDSGGLPDGARPAVRLREPAGLIGISLIAGVNLANWAVDLAAWRAATTVRAAVDPARGRLLFVNSPPASPPQFRVGYYAASPGPVGAGPYPRTQQLVRDLTLPDGTVQRIAPADVITGGGLLTAAELTPGRPVQIGDSATYDGNLILGPVPRITILAADGTRPYIALGADLIIHGTDGDVVIDGLWFGGGHDLVLTGTLNTVTLNNVTLDPGGLRTDGSAITPTRLVVDGLVRQLTISASILPVLRTSGAGAAEATAISDSVVPAPAGAPGIALGIGLVTLRRVTVDGDMQVRRLDASDVLITGTISVEDTQDGCFRFSGAGPGSIVPHPYRAVVVSDPGPLFVSRRFGDGAYYQLSAAAPAAIVRGAESGAEMGAYAAQMNPIKLDSLAAKVSEYMPFGLIPLFVMET
jgi:hypothetical protein